MNIDRIFDEYSQEDYLCHKLKPRDIPEYVCAHCNHDISEDDFGLEICFWCGEYLHPVEKS